MVDENRIQIDKTTCMSAYEYLDEEAKKYCCEKYGVCGEGQQQKDDEQAIIEQLKKIAKEKEDYHLLSRILILERLARLERKLIIISIRLYWINKYIQQNNQNRNYSRRQTSYRKSYRGSRKWMR